MDIIESVKAIRARVRRMQTHLDAVMDELEGTEAPPDAPVDEGQTTVEGQGALSGREAEIFALMGEGQTVPAIAKQLGIATKSVHAYKDRLKAKLKIASTFDLYRAAEKARRQTTKES